MLAPIMMCWKNTENQVQTLQKTISELRAIQDRNVSC